MPYTTEKSPIFQVIESFFNQDRDRALRSLWSMLDGDWLSDQPPVTASSLNHGPLNTPAKRQEHVNDHWWGFLKNAAGNWDPKQEPFDPKTNPTTGFWELWYGDAEGIFRETIIRAFSVALGIPREEDSVTEQYRGQERPANMRGTRHWPLSIIWKCPSPWYEGWIEFKEWGPGPREGHVTMVLSTPAHGVQLYNTPVLLTQAKQADPPYNAYQLDPREPAGPNGMWVVSQVFHNKWKPPSNAASQSGNWSVPTPGATHVQDVGPVVVVATRVADGGVAPGGIPYTP
jgi:hypothetical protein